MFSQVSVCVSRILSMRLYPPDRHAPLGRHPLGINTLLGRHPRGRYILLWQTPPGRPPPQGSHCSGRYASYWNAFLLNMFLLVVIFILVDFQVVTLHNPKAFWFPFVDISSLCLVPGCLFFYIRLYLWEGYYDYLIHSFDYFRYFYHITLHPPV